MKKYNEIKNKLMKDIQKKETELNLIDVDIKNILYCVSTFLLCVIMMVVFWKKITVLEDTVISLISRLSIIGSLYNLDQVTKNDKGIYMIAYFVSTIQGIQLVTVMDKILEHKGWKNKLLFWFGTLFLELFLGFTVETYPDEMLIAIGVIFAASIFVYSFLCTVRITKSNWLILPLWLVELYFLNPISRYLWAYGLGWIVEMFTFALIMTIPGKLELNLIFDILMIVLTPFMVRLNAIVVEKCMSLFFKDLYDSEEICILDKIGLVVAGILLTAWLLVVIIMN